jgi:hypothetical protein
VLFTLHAFFAPDRGGKSMCGRFLLDRERALLYSYPYERKSLAYD